MQQDFFFHYSMYIIFFLIGAYYRKIYMLESAKALIETRFKLGKEEEEWN